jgi:5'-3' exonuclease
MGILGFYKWIKETYSEAFKPKWLTSYDHIYIDLNYCLHFCSYEIKSQQELLTRLFNLIDMILYKTIPTKSVIFSSDGPAPLAKLLLQRKRRLHTSRTESIDINTTTLNFTPGTEFMLTLKNKMQKYIQFIKNIYQVEVKFTESEYDEAEIKLKYELMNNIKKNKTDSHIMITNDADMVVLLSTLEQYFNVFIYSDNNVLSIGKLITLHVKKVGLTKNPNMDFAFLSIMMGNDYLPKIRYINYKNLWNSYKTVVTNDNNGIFKDSEIKVNKEFLLKVFTILIAHIKPHFIKTFNIQNMSSELYNNYCDGVMWCMDTYYMGKCRRYNYMYGYQDPPHPLGLIFSILKNKSLLDIKNNIYPPIDSTLYAILLLPKKAIDLLDNKYHPFVAKNQILYNEESCTKCLKFYNEINALGIDSDIEESDNELPEVENENEKEKEKEKKKKYIQKLLSLHKKQHETLILSDIEKIIDQFTNYIA